MDYSKTAISREGMKISEIVYLEEAENIGSQFLLWVDLAVKQIIASLESI